MSICDKLINMPVLRTFFDCFDWLEDKIRGNPPLAINESRSYTWPTWVIRTGFFALAAITIAGLIKLIK
jgi:hypothetical protein